MYNLFLFFSDCLCLSLTRPGCVQARWLQEGHLNTRPWGWGWLQGLEQEEEERKKKRKVQGQIWVVLKVERSVLVLLSGQKN